MSKKIRTLVMALVIASITSTGAFAASDNNSVASTGRTWVLRTHTPYEVVGVTKTLTPVGDGTSVYESKLGKSNLNINGVVRSETIDSKTMLWAKGPVTVNFSNGSRYILQYDKLMYRVSGGKIVFIRPEMDNIGYIAGAREKEYLKELPFQAGYQKDKAVTLTEPGLYQITDSSSSEGGNECLLYVGNSAEELNLVESKIENAVASSLNVTVADKTTSLPAYNINGENYIRTKDLSSILHKTTREFNETDNNIVTGSMYTPNGSELKALQSGNAVATPYKELFGLNNEKVEPSMYTINNEQFISLSDMNSFLNLGLSVNGNVVTMSNVSNMATSGGRVTVKQVCITNTDHAPWGYEALVPKNTIINVTGLTDEQIKEKLNGFDTKQVWITAKISDNLRDYLKSNYETLG
ncbi:hypothetical protein GKZ28_05230 [Clostridium chromiireducens]|uniref:Uncharacterized protein n=1 Tax=Clostridium chromiireducens TaxID=225345 RepID=A0A964W1G2_9CLOT|nr:hypothetical protein [Clostridium chromiireducens]MVX63100.1 hypothetical protein [Clostridium chromiireducens]